LAESLEVVQQTASVILAALEPSIAASPEPEPASVESVRRPGQAQRSSNRPVQNEAIAEVA
jgi:hypothetical protein